MRIRFRTKHIDAETVAKAVSPDNTEEIQTEAIDGVVITTIKRDKIGSLHASADDYLRNLAVASEAVELCQESGFS